MDKATYLSTNTLEHHATAQSILQGLSSSGTNAGVISVDQVQALCNELQLTPQQLASYLVPYAQDYAIVPVSNYKVGAVGIGTTGAMYFGANLEVKGEALSFTVHAEQACTMNAWINGEQGLTTLAISAAPCGYCRQFLYELVDAAELQIVLPQKPPQLLTDFLPDSFGPSDLGITGGLMQP